MATNNSWRRWETEDERQYGEVLYRRAIGELPEMESSKAAAELLAPFVRPDDHILDVGCGAGHYLKSFQKSIQVPFFYTGADATPYYLELAKKAFPETDRISFAQADIFNLPFADASFDIVTANNVLLHLPNIIKPVEELCRVAKRTVIIRSLIGNRSFRIQEVQNKEPEFDDQGEPTAFFYYNIYSENYIRYLTSKLPRVRSVKIEADTSFSEQAIEDAVEAQKNKIGVTKMLAGKQTNGYLILPWSFVTITLDGGVAGA